MADKRDMNNKFYYFLNAIHYCIYLEEVWTNKKIDNTVTRFLAVIFNIQLFAKSLKNAGDAQNYKDFKYGNNIGLSIVVAHNVFGYFYLGYPLFISFVLGGITLRECGYLSTGLKLIILIIPIGLCYIPAYKAVFANDRYLRYFKQFEKEGENWHRKWKWITVVFCVCSIITSILGICAAFAIAIV